MVLNLIVSTYEYFCNYLPYTHNTSFISPWVWGFAWYSEQSLYIIWNFIAVFKGSFSNDMIGRNHFSSGKHIFYQCSRHCYSIRIIWKIFFHIWNIVFKIRLSDKLLLIGPLAMKTSKPYSSDKFLILSNPAKLFGDILKLLSLKKDCNYFCLRLPIEYRLFYGHKSVFIKIRHSLYFFK